MGKLRVFVSAILAGISTALGAIVFLTIENKVVGSVFFSIAAFAVLTQGLHLFTGKICYVFDKDKAYALEIPLIWFGNLVGAILTGSMLNMTRAYYDLAERAESVSAAKLNDGLLSVFLLGILCNILIFIAVDSYNRVPHETGKYYGVLFGIAVFVTCGFENSIANMLYFTIAKVWSIRTFGYLIVMSLGNAVGGMLLPVCRKFILEKKDTKEEKEVSLIN